MKDTKGTSLGYSLPQLISARAIDNHHIILPVVIVLRLPQSTMVKRPFQRDLHVIAQLITRWHSRPDHIRSLHQQINENTPVEKVGLIQHIRLKPLWHAIHHFFHLHSPHAIIMKCRHAALAVCKRILSQSPLSEVQAFYVSLPPFPATFPRQIPPVPPIVLCIHHVVPIIPPHHQFAMIVSHCVISNIHLLHTFHWLFDTLVAIDRFLNWYSQMLPTMERFSFHFTFWMPFPLLPFSPARVPRSSVMCTRHTSFQLFFSLLPLSVRSTITPSFFST